MSFEPVRMEPCGALVFGWDPSKRLAQEHAREIRAALVKHLVLVFRGRGQMRDEELIDFVECFGAMRCSSSGFCNTSKRTSGAALQAKPCGWQRVLAQW